MRYLLTYNLQCDYRIEQRTTNQFYAGALVVHIAIDLRKEETVLRIKLVTWTVGTRACIFTVTLLRTEGSLLMWSAAS